jgi:Fur family iron response transcriptional regulator
LKFVPSVSGARAARQKLNDVGLRPTRQRLALFDMIFAKGPRHTTAEELFDEARDLRFNCSLATIYNTLHQFEEAGLLREVASYGGKLWYDTTTGPHCHFYDVEEGKLFDIPDELVPKCADLKLPEGLELVSIDIVVRVKQAQKEA